MFCDSFSFQNQSRVLLLLVASLSNVSWGRVGLQSSSVTQRSDSPQQGTSVLPVLKSCPPVPRWATASAENRHGPLTRSIMSNEKQGIVERKYDEKQKPVSMPTTR